MCCPIGFFVSEKPSPQGEGGPKGRMRGGCAGAARFGAFPLGGKVAAGRMRGKCPAASRLRDRAKHFALISQRAGPLTASPEGEAIYRFPLR